MPEQLAEISPSSSERMSPPFRRPNVALLFYLWTILFFVFYLAVGTVGWLRFSLSFTELVTTIFRTNVVGNLLIITIWSIISWVLLYCVDSYVTLRNYRVRSVVGPENVVPSVYRVKSERGWGYRYFGARVRSLSRVRYWQILSDHETAHTLLLGDKRVNWWERYLLPQLLLSAEWENATIIIDPEATEARAEQLGSWYTGQYSDVQLFMPFSGLSHHLYLLEGAQEWDIARELAWIVIPEKQAQQERLLFTVLIAVLAQREPVSLGMVYRLLVGKRETLESMLLSATELVWEFDNLSTQVFERLATRLEPFNDARLDRWSVPKNFHSDVDVTYGYGMTHIYAGIPVDVPGRDVLLRLTVNALCRQLLDRTYLLYKPIILLPQLEAYGYIGNLTETLSALKSLEISVCGSLPSARAGKQLYGEEFERLKQAFSASLRCPRHAYPDDIELYRASAAHLPMSSSHSYLADVWQRIRKPAHYEPLLVPWWQRYGWRSSAALLHRKEQKPALVYLPSVKEARDAGNGLLGRLVSAYNQQELLTLNELVTKRGAIADVVPQLVADDRDRMSLPTSSEIATETATLTEQEGAEGSENVEAEADIA